MSSLNTVMPYSESVSINRNIPKAKGSPKWRPKPSAEKTRFMEKPNFITRAGKLVDVSYGRRHCNSRDDITLQCTYFVANKRYLIFWTGIIYYGTIFIIFNWYLTCQGWLQTFVLAGLSHNFRKTILCLFIWYYFQKCKLAVPKLVAFELI